MLTPSHCCPAGWWTGSKQSEPGRVGIFPGSYVEGLGLAEAAVAAAGEAAGEAEGAAEEEGGEAAAAPGRDSNMSDASQASTASQAADARAAIFAQMQAAESEAAEAPRPAPAATGGPAALKKWQQQEQPKGDEKRVRAVNLERVKVEGAARSSPPSCGQRLFTPPAVNRWRAARSTPRPCAT